MSFGDFPRLIWAHDTPKCHFLSFSSINRQQRPKPKDPSGERRSQPSVSAGSILSNRWQIKYVSSFEMRYVIVSHALTLTHTIISQRSAGEFTPLLIAGKIGGRNFLDQGGDAAYAVVWKARIPPLTYVCARVDDACLFTNACMFVTCCDMFSAFKLCISHSRPPKSHPWSEK